MISVIVATYNRELRLWLMLTALARQEGGFEVIVADDGSTDGTAKVVQQSWPMTVKYVWHPHDKFGLARTRNEGAKIAQGELFHFLDSDILLFPGSLTAAWELFVENPKSPIGGQYDYLPPATLIPWDIEQQWHLLTQGKIVRDGIQLDLGPILPDVRDAWRVTGRVGEDVFLHEHNPMWSGLLFLGANMVIPRYCFEKVGGFDEQFTMYGGEDADMSLNLISHGFPIRYSRRIKGLHIHHQANQDANQAGENVHLQYLFEKYPQFWLSPGVPNPEVWGKPQEET